MTTFATIPLDKITLHPDNVRRDAAADEEMVESIRAQGILQALGVVPEGDHYLLIAGHRRLDGARQAGLTAVPASILEHLTTRGQQIEAMLVENGQRVDLTPMEEAKAYEQLTLEGYKAKDIAKATGRGVGTVQARLKLNTLGDAAQAKIHARELSLDDALKLTQLEDHPDLLDDVMASAGTNNFDWALSQAFQRIERTKKWDETRADFIARGLSKIDIPEDGWNSTTGPFPHVWRPTMEADAWAESASLGPILVVSVMEPAEAPAERTHRESDWENQQAERDAAREAAKAAQVLRAEHLRTILNPAKLSTPILTVVRLALSADLAGWQREDLSIYVGDTVTRGDVDWGEDWAIADQVNALPDKTIASLAFVRMIADLEEHLDRAETTAKTGRAKHALAYYDLLTSTGYVLADIEIEHQAAVAANLAALIERDEVAA